MIVRFGKIHTLTRDTHIDTRCLGRRILLVGNIWFSRMFKTFLYLQFIYIQILTFQIHTNTYIQIKTLKYL